jgi:hypothetical protein
VSNKLYPSALDGIGTSLINLVSDDIRMMLVDSGYVYSDAHVFLSDGPAAHILGTVTALSGKTLTSGVWAASSPVVFVAPPDGFTVNAVVIYKHTGVNTTARLIAYFDAGFNLPLDLNGNNASIALPAALVTFKRT